MPVEYFESKLKQRIYPIESIVRKLPYINEVIFISGTVICSEGAEFAFMITVIRE